MSDKILVQYFSEGVTVLFGFWVVYRRFVSSKPMPRLLAVSGRFFRFCLILITFGMLGGCMNSDPLAVASGPLFPLNAGHWQPVPDDLAAPPAVVDR